jgi:hypothetical protein
VKQIVLALVVMAFCSASFAASPSAAGVALQTGTVAAMAQKSAAQGTTHSPDSSICSLTFTTGSFDTLLKFCVTANGNITQFETPLGAEHVAVGDASEGYGICDFTSNLEYFDYADAGASTNWGPASVVTQTTKSVRIARTTSDGIWTLTQTITQIAGNLPSAQVVMGLTNNSTSDRSVRLMRFVDVDADGVFFNNLDSTNKGAFGWNSFGLGHAYGLVLFNVGKTHFDHGGFVQNVPGGPAPCDPFAHSSLSTLTNTDGSLVHIYNIDVPKSTTATVTVGYKGM